MCADSAYPPTCPQVTLASDARYRDVIETALSTLVECLPSIAAAEVWQADENGSIRCIQGLSAGDSRFYRRNQRVDGLLHDEDVEDFRADMEPQPVSNDVGETSTSARRGGRNPAVKHQEATPDIGEMREGLIIRPRLTRGILAARYHDCRYKVGRSWIGADRLARGFALVLRVAERREQVSILQLASTSPASTYVDCPATLQHSKSRTPGALSVQDGMPSEQIQNVEDGNFAAEVAAEVGLALACVRGRERREAMRALALKRISHVCVKAKPSAHQARDTVLAEISSVLPGCRAYIGELQPGGNTLRYEAATANSDMLGRQLHRGEGISFTCLDDFDRKVRIIPYRDGVTFTTARAPAPPSLTVTARIGVPKPPDITVGESVEVWYGSRWLPATAVRDRGHQCFDVRYEEFRETEAGVPRWRLREVVAMEHLKVKIAWNSSDDAEEEGKPGQSPSFDPQHTDGSKIASVEGGGREGKSWPWPFVCVPLRHSGNRVGVLGIDGWSGVQVGRSEEVHPEKAVVSFLVEAGSMLAAAIYEERRNKALSAITKAVGGKDSTDGSALEALLVLLRETITFRRRLDVLETRAADPEKIYCRGMWESMKCPAKSNSGKQRQGRQKPVSMFERKVARQADELCVTAAQLKALGSRHAGGSSLPGKGQHSSFGSQAMTPYQREMHLILRDGPGAGGGLQATTLSSRHGEVVGRLQRLVVRPGGARPSANGWYLVRVSRSLPEDAVQPRTELESRTGSTVAVAVQAGQRMIRNSEEGDLSLLSEMCRKLEVGFMAIASREQREMVRAKALDRVFSFCKRMCLTPPHTKDHRPIITGGSCKMQTSSGEIVRTGSQESLRLSAHRGGSDGSEKGDRQMNNFHAKIPTLPRKATAANKVNAKIEWEWNGNESASLAVSDLPATTAPVQKDGALGTNYSQKEIATGESTSAHGSVPEMTGSPVQTVDSTTTAALKIGQRLLLPSALPSATAAETPDGRKGALVSLKDGRLAVLVWQGDRRVAVVELPGGKLQTMAESEASVAQ